MTIKLVVPLLKKNISCILYTSIEYTSELKSFLYKLKSECYGTLPFAYHHCNVHTLVNKPICFFVFFRFLIFMLLQHIQYLTFL